MAELPEKGVRRPRPLAENMSGRYRDDIRELYELHRDALEKDER